ncbi:COBRA-like protein 1 [Striga hermonthica]|uniref:COBRA-like protein n=1 Tax=Striga hermonthica TaxID=68872 RepID=A0A9N7RQ80_STRHE|nr:COBRA-like protein 1 [Striga hermonthica]
MIVRLSCNADGYDPLDPNGNITIRWDVLIDNGDGTQDVRLSIVNNQLFRHVEPPGWRLSWAWAHDEVIWAITGAETTEQGNCSRFKGSTLPHCCDKEPVIIDLLPGTPYNKQVANCCRAGVLSSVLQDPGRHVAAFQMHVGGSKAVKVPENFTLGIPGYTCGPALRVVPTKFSEDQGRRTTQALETHNVTCSYSQFRASVAPRCCVSLSAFYNTTIVQCPRCSCACQGQPGSSCLKPGEMPPVLQLPHNEPPKPLVQCSIHMCPIQVHWHIKQSYKEYWRVKITVNNLNFAKNYSDWNMVVLHPNLKNVTQVFSFNYKPLNVYGDINDTGIFYGIQYYNDVLLQLGKNGNVQSEMLLNKDRRTFSFRQGWAFPRKISFNGEDCVMPSPDDYPRLPNSARFHAQATAASVLFLLPFLLLLVA